MTSFSQRDGCKLVDPPPPPTKVGLRLVRRMTKIVMRLRRPSEGGIKALYECA
jgi:hypothetical protein